MANYPAARSGVLGAYQRLKPRLDTDTDTERFQHDVIACGDDSLRDAALALGRALGRPVETADISAGWLGTAADPTSVLLFARRGACSAEMVRDWVSSALRRGVPLGFVLAAGQADADYQVRKTLLAHTRMVAGDDAVIDAVNGYCGQAGELDVARPERLTEVLAAQWRVLAIGGHSDLSHMSLGSHVICGAAEPEQVDGTLLADGCDPGTGRCRRKLGFQRTSVPAQSLRAAVVALMGCSSFDLTAGEYPSSNSLCASTLSGQPFAVVGTLGLLYADFDAARQFVRTLADGLTLGAAVLSLNRAHQIPSGYGFALAGDPALRFAPRPATAGAAAPAASPARDCRELAQPLLARFGDVISRTRSARRLHRALVRTSDSLMEPGLVEALQVLGRRCELVEEAAWEGIRLLNEAVSHRYWQEPDRVVARLDRAIGRWDSAFIAAASLFSGNDMYSALHEFHSLVSAGSKGSCGRCGSRIERFRYLDPEQADVQRIAAECWRCGPVLEAPGTGPQLSIVEDALHQPGARARPRLSVVDLSGSPVTEGHLAVVLNDRPGDQVLAAHQVAGSLADLLDVTITVPAGARSDLHVLWAVWASELTVTFAATRLAVVRMD
jgi:hypothetical protein